MLGRLTYLPFCRCRALPPRVAIAIRSDAVNAFALAGPPAVPPFLPSVAAASEREPPFFFAILHLFLETVDVGLRQPFYQKIFQDATPYGNSHCIYSVYFSQDLLTIHSLLSYTSFTMTKKQKQIDADSVRTDEFITTGEASKVSHVGIAKINQWCEDGSLNFFLIPGSTHRRVSVISLRAFLLKSKVPTDLIDKEYPV